MVELYPALPCMPYTGGEGQAKTGDGQRKANQASILDSVANNLHAF